MRFSPRFLNVFFRFPPAVSFFSFSGVTPSGAGSALAMQSLLPMPAGAYIIHWRRGPTPAANLRRCLASDSHVLGSAWPQALHRFLLRNRALARSFARPRVGLRPLPADGQRAAV